MNAPEAVTPIRVLVVDYHPLMRDGIAIGLANKTIAAVLGISEDTVKVHMKSVFAKLGVRDRAQAAMVAIGRGLVQS